VALACSLGVSFAPLLPTAAADDKPGSERLLTSEQLKRAASEHKLEWNQVKQLQADIDALAASRQKLAAFEATLTPETRNVQANQSKRQALQAKVQADKAKLAGDQQKFGVKDWSNT
jgi:hypothetical protein